MSSVSQSRPDRSYAILTLMNALYFIMVSLIIPYLPAYYQMLNFSMLQIGILISTGAVCSVLVQPMWSHASDRIGDRVRILRFLLAGSMFAILLFVLPTGFVGLFLVVALFQSFNTAIIPVQDAISLSYCNQTHRRYSLIRLGGTIGFSLTVVLAGVLAGDSPSDMRRLFLAAAGVFMVMLLMTRWMPRIDSYVVNSRVVSLRALLRSRRLIAFLLFLFIYQFNSSFLFAFLSVHIRNLGLSNVFVGYAQMISAASEIPVLLLVDRVLKKHSPARLLLVAGLMLTIRLLLTSSAVGFGTIAIAQCFHGLSMMIAFYASIQFINREVPEQLKASGIGLLTLIKGGLAPISSSLIGGWLADLLTIPAVLRLNMGFILLCTVAGTILYLFRRRLSILREPTGILQSVNRFDP